MKPEKFLTDDQVLEEIERLRQSEYVALARKETRIKYRQRQILYNLRNMEKRGRALAKQGYTADNIEELMLGAEGEEDCEA